MNKEAEGQQRPPARSTDPGLKPDERRVLYALERMTPMKRRLTEAGLLPAPAIQDCPLPPGFKE